MVIDAITQQLEDINLDRTFYMTSYLIFLLIDGKNREGMHANIEFLFDATHPGWESYPRLYAHSRWEDRNWKMAKDNFEDKIIIDIKGLETLPRISTKAIMTLKGVADFFVQDPCFTYIRVYGSDLAPYRLPRYASDRLVFIEFTRHMYRVYEKVVAKKGSDIYTPPYSLGLTHVPRERIFLL